MAYYTLGRLNCLNSIISNNENEQLVLDIGCGENITFNLELRKIFSNKQYNYIGLDISRKNLSRIVSYKNGDLLKKGHYILADCLRLPFRTCYYLVLALEIIEHLNKPDNFLREIQRVLAINGYIIISTPNKLSFEGIAGKIREIFFRIKWYAWDPDHLHIYSSFEFISFLKNYFYIRQILGFYYLPSLNLFNKLNYILKFSFNWLNKFGFQIMIVARAHSSALQGD